MPPILICELAECESVVVCPDRAMRSCDSKLPTRCKIRSASIAGPARCEGTHLALHLLHDLRVIVPAERHNVQRGNFQGCPQVALLHLRPSRAVQADTSITREPERRGVTCCAGPPPLRCVAAQARAGWLPGVPWQALLGPSPALQRGCLPSTRPPRARRAGSCWNTRQALSVQPWLRL